MYVFIYLFSTKDLQLTKNMKSVKNGLSPAYKNLAKYKTKYMYVYESAKLPRLGMWICELLWAWNCDFLSAWMA